MINAIYENNLPKVVSFVLTNTGSKQDAEDIFQKALLQLATRHKARPFEIKSSFEAYLFTVCKNLWRRELNSTQKRVTKQSLTEPSYDPRDIALSALEQERWELFANCFKLLSDNCRSVLKMFFNKIPYSQIVDKMGYNSETVARQRVFKCKAKLIALVRKDTSYDSLKEL